MNLLCVLARVPSPGTGKSRLRVRLGDAVTDRLARAFLEDVLDWSGTSADEVLVAHEGPAALLPPCGPAPCHLLRQLPGDLGVRIAAAVDAGFARGASRVVIIGTDCPTLPADILQDAFAGLTHAGSTLVPATDGGWIALGVNRPLWAALDGVAWSTELTGGQTIAALQADGRPPLVLPAWYDVDEPADLDRIRGDPGSLARAPRTCAALGAMAVGAR